MFNCAAKYTPHMTIIEEKNYISPSKKQGKVYTYSNHYTVPQKTSPTFLAVTQESIVGFS